MKQLIKSILTDVGDKASSKRFGMLWLLIVMWTFIHVMIFLVQADKDMMKTLIEDDLILILSFGGFVVGERMIGNKKNGNDTNDDTKPQSR